MSGGSECDRGECVNVARFLYTLEKRGKNDMVDFLDLKVLTTCISLSTKSLYSSM